MANAVNAAVAIAHVLHECQVFFPVWWKYFPVFTLQKSLHFFTKSLECGGVPIHDGIYEGVAVVRSDDMVQVAADERRSHGWGFS